MERRLIVGEDAYVFLLTAWFSHSMDYIDDKLYLYRYGVGITAQEENMKKFVRMANDLQIIPALYAFAEEQKHEGHDVSDFLEAVNYFCRYELKICLDGIYYTSSCLEAKKNILSYCIQYTPEETAQELASLLTKQKAELDKAYRDIDNLQERFDVLSHTKAVRFAHFINHLLHWGETE